MKGITLWGVYENGDITSGATSKDSRDTDKGNTVQAVRKMSQAKNLWKDKAVTRIYRKIGSLGSLVSLVAIKIIMRNA